MTAEWGELDMQTKLPRGRIEILTQASSCDQRLFQFTGPKSKVERYVLAAAAELDVVQVPNMVSMSARRGTQKGR
jgi:hypothetical protein